MDPPPVAAARGIRRRRLLAWALVVTAAAVLLAVGVRILVQPEQIARLALDQVGKALGLDISATDVSQLQLRGTPTLELRGLDARQPGAATPVLSAKRALLALPWATVRARGQALDFTRLELDAPVLDLDALQAWRATRPPGDDRIATLRRGLAVRDGTLLAGSWRLESWDVDVPSLHPRGKLRALSRGTYVNADTSLPFDLAVVMTRPAFGSALGVAGDVRLRRPGWQVPARVTLSGRLQTGGNRPGEAGWGIAAMVLSADARYRSTTPGGQSMPFALGLAAPLRVTPGRLALAPLGLAIRVPDGSGNTIPPLLARGTLVQEEFLDLRLEGTLERWPSAWPALPSPLDRSTRPLPFSLAYAGPSDLSGTANLALERGPNRFDGRFRLPDVQAWLDEEGRLSPLPPINGNVRLPRLDIPGATLHGVELTIEDPAVDADGSTGTAGAPPPPPPPRDGIPDGG